MVYLAGNHWHSFGCCGSVPSFEATLMKEFEVLNHVGNKLI
jgi:hypothetical protein